MVPQRFRPVALALVLIHLSFVSLFAFTDVDFAPLARLGKAIDFYTAFSGSGAGYSFFAPGVGVAHRARFELFAPDGTRSEARLERHLSHEADLRVGNIVSKYQRYQDDERVRRALVASLAGKMLGRHPDAHAVAVHIEVLDPLTMQDFRNGRLPLWQPVYHAKFVRKAELRSTSPEKSGPRPDPAMRRLGSVP